MKNLMHEIAQLEYLNWVIDSRYLDMRTLDEADQLIKHSMVVREMIADRMEAASHMAVN